MFHIVKRPDGFYVMDPSGKVVDGPFETRFLAQQSLNRMQNPQPQEEPAGPPMGVPPMMGPGGPPVPGGAPQMDPQMLMALLAKLKGGAG